MTVSSSLTCSEHLPVPRQPMRPVGYGTGESGGLSVSDDEWIFSFSTEGVVPLKIKWLGRDFDSAIKQQKIDDVISKAWPIEKSKIRMDFAQEPRANGETPAVKKSMTALYLSLAAMSQTVLGCIAPGDLSLCTSMTPHRYDVNMDVFFIAFDKRSLRIPTPHQSAAVQSLTWVLDNIAELNLPGIHGLVIDGLQDVDEKNAPIIIALLNDIQVSGLALFVVQETPAKLLRVNDLEGLIVKDSCLSFVVSGLMKKCK